MDMEVTTHYIVYYQTTIDSGTEREGTWYNFQHGNYKHATKNSRDATTSLEEAYQAAQDLYDGKIFTDSRPAFRDHVKATQVIQNIYVQGTLLTFGSPVEETTG